MQHVTFEPISNRETWSDTIEVTRNGTLVDLSTATILLSLRSKQSKSILMTARTGGGITLGSTGVFSFTFTPSQMRDLEASIAYEVGCTVEFSTGVIEQLFIGTISVLDGIVE